MMCAEHRQEERVDLRVVSVASSNISKAIVLAVVRAQAGRIVVLR